jgi:signal transduction histidine kinase
MRDANVLLSRGLTIRSKLLLFTLGIGCLILIAIVVMAYFLSARSLRNARLDGFRSLRNSLSQSIERFVIEYRRDIATQTEMQNVRYAVTELASGYENLIDDLEQSGFQVNNAFLDTVRAEVRAYYEKVLFPALDDLGRAHGDFETFSDLSSEGLLLQYVYLVANGVPLGSKWENNLSTEVMVNQQLPETFRSAFSKTMYARAIDRYHPLIGTLVQRQRYNDFILIDGFGNVVYTYKKTWDYGTNVFRGWRADSHLKSIFANSWYTPFTDGGAGDLDHVKVTDMDRYQAQFDAPVLFIGAAVPNRVGGKVGVLVHELSHEQFTELVTFDRRWANVGLGATGEAYIVGSDRRLRTESRFVKRAPTQMKARSYTPDGTKGEDTVILAAPLTDVAVERIYANTGPANSGDVAFKDDFGVESLGVYAPLPIPDLNWGLVIKISAAEAFAPAVHLSRLVGLGGLITLIAAIAAALLFGHFLSRPIGQLVRTTDRIVSGDPTARAPVSSSDEIGFLAERFNFMVDQLDDRNRQVRKILETVNEGLFLMGPDLVIQRGYSSATTRIFHRELEGVSFLELLRPGQNPECSPVLSEQDRVATRSFLELLLNPKIKEKLIQQTNPLSEVEFRVVDERRKLRTKYLEFRFNRVVEHGRTTQVMVTVHDATSRVSLSREIRHREEQARNQIEMLFGVLHVEPKVLSEFLDQCHTEIVSVLGLLEAEQFSSHAKESGSERKERYARLLKGIFRSVHLVKGNAAMLRLSYFEHLAGQLEEIIADVRSKVDFSGEDFLPITVTLASLLDQINMTRELIGRLNAMQQVFGNAPDPLHDLKPVANLAREIAARNGRKVRVSLQAKDGLGNLPDRIRGPVQTVLTQLLRNAVVHGIEPASERRKAGKPETGEIRVVAYRGENKNLILAVRDDGRGINYDLLRERAIELEYGNQENIRYWPEEKLLALLFESGFSTLTDASRDAGRGVGLDVVKEVLAKIGGRLDVSSQSGRFCEFRIEIPNA